MVKGQEFPVEVYFVRNLPGVSEVTFTGFPNLKTAVMTIPDLLNAKLWIDVSGDQTRFETRGARDYLRKPTTDRSSG